MKRRGHNTTSTNSERNGKYENNKRKKCATVRKTFSSISNFRGNTSREQMLLRELRAKEREIRRHTEVGVLLLRENRLLKSDLLKMGPVPETVDLTDEIDSDVSNNDMPITAPTTAISTSATTTTTTTANTATTNETRSDSNNNNDNNDMLTSDNLPGIDVKLEQNKVGLDINQLEGFGKHQQNDNNRFRMKFDHCFGDTQIVEELACRAVPKETAVVYSKYARRDSSGKRHEGVPFVHYKSHPYIAGQPKMRYEVAYNKEIGLNHTDRVCRDNANWNGLFTYIASTCSFKNTGISSFRISFLASSDIHLYLGKVENDSLILKQKFGQSQNSWRNFTTRSTDVYVAYDFTAYMNTNMLYYRKVKDNNIDTDSESVNVKSMAIDSADKFILECQHMKTLIGSLRGFFPVVAKITPITRLSEAIVVSEIQEDTIGNSNAQVSIV